MSTISRFSQLGTAFAKVVLPSLIWTISAGYPEALPWSDLALRSWNALRKTYQLHTVSTCIEEATRTNKKGNQLVAKSLDQFRAELTIVAVKPRMQAEVTLRVGERTDLDPGERDLLAYALTLPGRAWWLCGPDNGTVNALQILRLLDRMVTLESLMRAVGMPVDALQYHFTEKWLADRRLRFALDDPA